MYYDFSAVLVFTVCGILFVSFVLWLGSKIRARRADNQPQQIYECGEPTIGSAWVRYNSRFYNIALVYLLFDVEVILLFPVAMVLRDELAAGLPISAVFGVVAFLALLTVGFAYEWFYGSIDWISSGSNNPHSSSAAETGPLKGGTT